MPSNAVKFLDGSVIQVPLIHLVFFPQHLLKSNRYGGEKRTKRILSETEKKPVTFEKITWRTNDYFWYRRTVSEGTKGPVTCEFMDRGLFCVKIDGLSGRFG